MNFSDEALNDLLTRFPGQGSRDQLIAFLNTLSVSSYVRRKYFTQWARVVGYRPTSDEYDRAARDAAPTPTGDR